MADPQAELAHQKQRTEQEFRICEIVRQDLAESQNKLRAAEARNEALLQALKEIGNFVGSPILSYTSYLEKEMEFLARIHKVSSIVRTALDSGSASQEAKTPGGDNA